MTTSAAPRSKGTGIVYILTNQATGNSVMVFNRDIDGLLTQKGTFPTGGLGIGGVTNPLDSLFSQGSLGISDDRCFLFAVDAGSDELSVLAVDGENLVLTDRVPSGGTTPVSVTVHKHVVYVLNRGDFNVGDGNITGFTVDSHGKLTPIPDSTQLLVGGPRSLPAQVQFSPDGKQLVVAERTNNLIDVFPVDKYGAAGQLVKNDSSGPGPFGMTFAGKDLLIVSELSGNTSSYRLDSNGHLSVISGSVSTDEGGACWVVTNSRTDPGYAYVSNARSGSISGYRIDSAGALSLLTDDGHTAVLPDSHAAIDSAVSGNEQFLYVVTGGFSENVKNPIISAPMGISAFQIENDGNLTPIHGSEEFAPVIEGLAPGTQGIVAT
ncbi:MAG: lactonase family protein [Pseudonocardiaceae bacterium]